MIDSWVCNAVSLSMQAYKRDSGRETAEQIIHAFALMRQRPVGDEDDEETTTTTTTDDDNIMIQDGKWVVVVVYTFDTSP